MCLISWPARIEPSDQVRHQYVHAIDVLPTLLDVIGIEAPTTVAGVVQQPLDGVSFLPTLASGGTLVLQLERGERRTLRVSPPLFDYFAPGDAVFKLDGFEWPEKWSPDEGRRVCIACGGVVELAEPMSACPRCGAPLPAHEAMQALAPRA